MKKQIIISGPKASGKTWISKAIAMQHSADRVLTINAKTLLKYVIGITHLGYLERDYDLIVVEECTRSDLPFFRQVARVNTYTRERFLTMPIETKINISIVYITSDSISQKEYPEYHVINCNNQY